MAYLAYRDNLVATAPKKGQVKTSIVLDAETHARLKHISGKTMIPIGASELDNPDNPVLLALFSFCEMWVPSFLLCRFNVPRAREGK